jgi:hypothetical protein
MIAQQRWCDPAEMYSMWAFNGAGKSSHILSSCGSTLQVRLGSTVHSDAHRDKERMKRWAQSHATRPSTTTPHPRLLVLQLEAERSDLIIPCLALRQELSLAA